MKSHRVIFIDLARAVAVVAMVYGHTIDAVLAPRYRAGAWFTAWQFQRGLTSCLFLLLSGFAFSIATTRHWPLHVELSPQLLHRTRRFVTFVVLGYVLHFPVSHVLQFEGATAEQWRSFLNVDVLQLIGVTFLLVQGLVLLARTRRAFAVAALAMAIVIVLTTPFVWAADWQQVLPPAAAAYLTPASGSQFPLFPWAGYVLLGVALGQLYARWGATHLAGYANYALLVPGTALVVGGLLVGEMPRPLFGDGTWNWVPPQVVVRAGACLITLGVVAHSSTRITRLPHAFSAVAQESLLIYFVHLCIVYGSIWNSGLAQQVGRSLEPGATVLVVALLLAAMVALAAYWNWQKHTNLTLARWITAGAWVVLVAALA